MYGRVPLSDETLDEFEDDIDLNVDDEDSIFDALDFEDEEMDDLPPDEEFDEIDIFGEDDDES